MEITGDILPGYRIFEYTLLVNPHEELRNRIAEVRKDFNSKYKVLVTKESKPNLPLVRFSQYEMMETRIINHLKTIAWGHAPFKVELKDFGSFPTHTIFINVTSKLPIQKLVKQIRTDTQRLMKLNSENKPYFHLEPHITIGSKLKPFQYEKGWLEFSQKSFTGRFIADSMLLLKRLPGDKQWQIVQRLEFKNLPVMTKQGDLFG